MKPRLSTSVIICLVVLSVIQISCLTSSSKPEPVSSMVWEMVGTGDCTGHDDPETTEGSQPDDLKAKVGYTAVCWDNNTYTNALNPGRAFCTYKKIVYTDCTGGENPGEMYMAVSQK